MLLIFKSKSSGISGGINKRAIIYTSFGVQYEDGSILNLKQMAIAVSVI